MQADELKLLSIKLMAVAELLEQRSERAVAHVETGAAALSQTAQELGTDAQRLSREVVAAITTQAQGAVEHGISQAAAECAGRLQDSARTAERASQLLQADQRAMRRELRGVIWIGLASLVVGSVLAAGGSAFVARKSLADIERARFGKDILRATESGALTRCGDALCARVGQAGRRYGNNGEYLLLE